MTIHCSPATRRPARLATVIAVVMAMLLLSACDWTMFRGGPARTGANPGETVVGAGNVAQLQLRWFQRLPDTDGRGGPVVADGIVYAHGFGDHSSLEAYDAVNGTERFEAQDGSDGAPTIAGGTIYIGSSVGQLWALDAKTGSRRWAAADAGAQGYSPVVASGNVYAAGVSGSTNTLKAFNASTGALVWAKGGTTYGSAPASADGLLYVNGADKRLHAIDAATGAEKWRADGGDARFAPTVSGGAVFVTDSSLRSFDAKTGAPRWAVPVGASAPVSVAGSTLLFETSSELHAVDAATGRQLWHVSSNNGVDPVYPHPTVTVANGVVYLGGVDHLLSAFAAGTGARLWDSTSHDELATSEPAIVNGVVYVTSRQGVNAFSLPTVPAQITMARQSELHQFDDVVDGATGDPIPFAVTNFGTNATSPITVTISGAAAGQFRISSNACAGVSLAGGATCRIEVAFQPTRAGAQHARLDAGAATGGTTSAALDGVGYPFTVDPPFVTFEPQRLQTSSAPVTFTIKNIATTSAKPLPDASLLQPNYRYVTDHCTGTTLAPGATCTVAATFTPFETHAQLVGVVSIGLAGAGDPRRLGNGFGVAEVIGDPILWVTLTGTTGFGTVPVGSTKSATFTFTNPGPFTTTPVGASLGPITYLPFGSITSDGCAGVTLAHGASCRVVVTFAPQFTGAASVSLNVGAANSGSALLRLDGTGA